MTSLPRAPGDPGASRGIGPLVWMGGASAMSCAAVTAAAGGEAHPEALFGMIGPLASAGATWIAMVRTHAAAPERLMHVLMTGFALKVVFFGAYVTVMLKVLTLRPVPFVVSFTAYFIALYVIEAALFRRLLNAAPRPVAGATEI